MALKEERPTLISLVKSASRDSRVSCETLGDAEAFHKPNMENLHDDEELDWAESEKDYGFESNGHGENKKFRNSKIFLGCFPPKSSAGNGRGGKFWQEPGSVPHSGPITYSGPIPHSGPISHPGPIAHSGPISHSGPIPHSGPVPHSGPLNHPGAVPHSGPIKLSTGSILGRSCVLTKNQSAAPKGHSGPFTLFPPGVVGKKKPSEFESVEPTSPEVSCIGRVHVKKNELKNRMEEDFRAKRRSMFVKKKAVSELSGDGKISKWKKMLHFGGTKDQEKSSIDPNHEFLARRLSSAGTPDSPKVHALPHDGHTREVLATNKALEKEEPSMPPANALLLMKGSRKADTEEKDSQAPPANALLLMRGSRRDDREGPEQQQGSSSDVPSGNKQDPRQDSTTEHLSAVDLWKRRSMVKSMAW